MSESKRNDDPYLGFKFRVELGGLTVGGFTEVSGLQAEVEVFDYREGGVNEYIHKLAGPVRYTSNLTLKHGLMDATTLWDWQQDIMQGDIRRENISIMLQDSAGKDRWRWNFKDAYPMRWRGPDLKASTAEVAVETLEFVHRGMTTQPV